MNRARLAMLAFCMFSPACFYGEYGGGAYSSPAPRTTMAQAQPAYHDRAFDATDDLDAFVTTETTGFVKEGAPVQSSLDAFMPVPVTLPRGRCYSMVVRLAPRASFSAHAR